ncbi:MAG: hypothetical protein ACRCU3_05655 [Eubacteriaceae bacterium]
MSLPLFIKDIKNNLVIFLVFSILMSIYLAVIIFMYNPEGLGAFNDLVALLPVTMINALGLEMIESGLTGFIASLYYGFLIYLFPLVYCVMVGRKLVAKFVYDGSFACLLSTPNSRVKIIVTQGLYFLVSIMLMFGIIYIVGIGVSENLYRGLLDTVVFFQLNIAACLMTMAIGMICFFFSCLCNTPKAAFIWGSVVTLFFFFSELIGSASERFLFMKNYSLYSLFDGFAIVNKTGNYIGLCGLFLVVTFVIFGASVAVFQFKRLRI